MTTNEILQIIAVLLSPVIALQVDKILRKSGESKKRKIDIFKILMASRGSILSIEHVAALNRIDLEFSNSKKYTKVISSWNLYFNHLNVKSSTEQELAIWNDKIADHLASLLFEMGSSLGYEFNIAQIKRNIYAPKGHFETENELSEIRKLLVSVLKGQSPLLMQADSTEDAIKINEEYIAKQMELQTLMIKHYQNTPPVSVKIIP